MTNKLFQQLADIYTTMDRAWDMTASQYGFQCEGCEDNCCTSLFFHHTFIEKAFLIHGVSQLAQDIKKEAQDRAEIYYHKTFPGGEIPASLKLMCPLNQDGRCLVYKYRPMICRLHGLPHELHKPGAAPFKGPGCPAGQFDKAPYIPFDRTPFYKEMATVEMKFRQRTGRVGKIKETVAQMILF
jgi:Fe-S-cluster containining protein